MKFMKSRGFTLIELLIVIALLGALAVGLLATIDPFEQLKKGRDTSLRNTVSEFYNANLRYYSTKGTFPWGDQTSGYLDTMTSDVIDTLISSGELKNRFADLVGTANLNKIYLYGATAENMSVCFKPESKSFQIEPNTVYDQSGATDGLDCKSTGGSDLCWYCIQ